MNERDKPLMATDHTEMAVVSLNFGSWEGHSATGSVGGAEVTLPISMEMANELIAEFNRGEPFPRLALDITVKAPQP